ncbi:MAG: reverse transcriptase-like protein, partial [Deltaproteobacteria bacterium]|nr:reverse transcriptase-like protein [Deltaproteobacteria bacterium]
AAAEEEPFGTDLQGLLQPRSRPEEFPGAAAAEEEPFGTDLQGLLQACSRPEETPGAAANEEEPFGTDLKGLVWAPVPEDPGPAPEQAALRLRWCLGKLKKIFGSPAPSDCPRPERYFLTAGVSVINNPGPAGLGLVIEDERGQAVRKLGFFIGACSSNAAQYLALDAGLLLARFLGLDRLGIRLDSDLVIAQLEGRCQVRDEKLKYLCRQTAHLLAGLTDYKLIRLIRRDSPEAGRLAGQAALEGSRGNLDQFEITNLGEGTGRPA